MPVHEQMHGREIGPRPLKVPVPKKTRHHPVGLHDPPNPENGQLCRQDLSIGTHHCRGKGRQDRKRGVKRIRLDWPDRAEQIALHGAYEGPAPVLGCHAGEWTHRNAKPEGSPEREDVDFTFMSCTP